MIEQDTIRLLRECDAGIQMGVSSIDDVVDHVHSRGLKKYLNDCREQHSRLKEEIDTMLHGFQDGGKAPNPLTRGMAHVRTNARILMDSSDAAIADIITDGCNMGVKSLNRYLNQYKAADERSKDITKRLINLEEKLTEEIRHFL